jgi:hypothetical protein
MARIRKLTPRLLKKIIKEEKQKISREKRTKRIKSLNENSVDALTKLALQEIKVLLEAKRIRKKRKALKKKITKKMR